MATINEINDYHFLYIGSFFKYVSQIENQSKLFCGFIICVVEGYLQKRKKINRKDGKENFDMRFNHEYFLVSVLIHLSWRNNLYSFVQTNYLSELIKFGRII